MITIPSDLHRRLEPIDDEKIDIIQKNFPEGEMEFETFIHSLNDIKDHLNYDDIAIMTEKFTLDWNVRFSIKHFFGKMKSKN